MVAAIFSRNNLYGSSNFIPDAFWWTLRIFQSSFITEHLRVTAFYAWYLTIKFFDSEVYDDMH